MNLTEFIRWAIENGPFDGCDLDGASVQDKAVDCGILVQTKYDPKKHGGSSVAAPGDDWLVFSEEFLAASKTALTTGHHRDCAGCCNPRYDR